MSEEKPIFQEELIKRLLVNFSLEEAVEKESNNEELLKEVAENCLESPPIRISSSAEQVLFKAYVKARPKLQSIDISHSVFLSDDLVMYLVNCCPDLRKVRIWNCLSLHDAALLHISHLKNLTSLCAGDNKHFTTAGFSAILRSCPELTELNFSCCPQVDDSLGVDIALFGKNLRCLTGEFLPKFATDTLLISLASSSSLSLERLILGNGSISNFGIEELSKSDRLKESLVAIDVRRNTDIAHAGYNKLSSDFHLQELDGVKREDFETNAGQYFMSKRLQAEQ